MNHPFQTDAFRLLFRFGGLAALFYGAFIWLCNSFAGSNAFALYASAPPPAFALPLIVGGSAQFIGCCLYRRGVAIAGAACCLGIFLAAEISCLSAQRTSTGVPAYLVISGFYALLIYCAARVPLPCARASSSSPLSS